jgi:Zn-dependent protease
MESGWTNVLLLVPVMLFSLCVHEYAHAWVATKRGDPTPASLGRLTLQPWAHWDLLGTILLPVACIYYGLPFIGWAKPVPVDIRNLKWGRRDMALVAMAGPIANVILALLATALLGGLVRAPIEAEVLKTIQIFTVVAIQVNLMLAIFNLLPVPPLDGFNIVQGVLPIRWVIQLAKMAPLVNLLLLAMLFTGGLRYLAIPGQIAFRFLTGLVLGER